LPQAIYAGAPIPFLKVDKSRHDPVALPMYRWVRQANSKDRLPAAHPVDGNDRATGVRLKLQPTNAKRTPVWRCPKATTDGG
jgi:hypothetical protein